MIVGVPAAFYDRVAKWVDPYLEHFAKRSPLGSSADIFRKAILSQDLQLWVHEGGKMVALTEVTLDAVHIVCCAGVDRNEWRDALDEAVQGFANSLGKKRIVATVRPGWFKYGKSKGYREAHRVMVRELSA